MLRRWQADKLARLAFVPSGWLATVARQERTIQRSGPSDTVIQLADEPDFAVGSITARPSQSRIIAQGKVSQIEPRMMQVLVALAQANSGTVARRELIERCWGGIAVSDDALNRVVARLRQMLEQTAAGAKIETLPRIGYRLLPSVGESPPPAAPPVSALPLVGGHVQELYRRALHGLEQPSREQLEQAAGMLREVTQRNPGEATGWAALAEAQRLLILYLPPDLQAPASAEAWRSAERALAIAPATGDALATMADLIPRFGRWDEIERRFDEALHLAPGNERILLAKAQFLAATGRSEECTRTYEALFAANPLSARIAIGSAAALFDNGRDADALRRIDEAQRRWPALLLAWSECVRLHVAARNFTRAQSLLDDPPSSVVPEDHNLARRRLHLIAIRDRRPSDLAAAVANFTAFAETGLEPAVVAVYALTTLGATEAALDVAEAIFTDAPRQAHAYGQTMMRTYALAGQPDPAVLFRRDTSTLRQSPRFGTILEQIGLRWPAIC